MSDNCVDFKTNDTSCIKLKRYLSACPDAKPVRAKIDIQISKNDKIKMPEKDVKEKKSSSDEDDEDEKGGLSKIDSDNNKFDKPK